MFRVAAALVLLSSPAFAQVSTLAATDGKNALGTVPCATGGAPMSSCHAELRHHDDGTTTLAVGLGSGEVRSIYFTDGVPSSSSSPARISHETRGDLTVIYIDPDEVYEIPTAALKRQ
ncbi:hypothetical protein [Ruegeria sp. Ofav3-42]|uniref:hypothetical protein n=1 Tax=Ruegeria sp. Ofav3-42 TaxID=2917759 RepID=UPI001EF5819E|nr:hypothetical protein [Ruegeria sp. Ofav3-42]MCG7518765.1 hypothetical protein [Ruegeria sp. Ofav3-42]